MAAKKTTQTTKKAEDVILCIQNRGFLILKVDRQKGLYYDYIVDKNEDRDSSSGS